MASVLTSPLTVILMMACIVSDVDGNAAILTASDGRWHTPFSAVRKSLSMMPMPLSSPTLFVWAYSADFDDIESMLSMYLCCAANEYGSQKMYFRSPMTSWHSTVYDDSLYATTGTLYTLPVNASILCESLMKAMCILSPTWMTPLYLPLE